MDHKGNSTYSVQALKKKILEEVTGALPMAVRESLDVKLEEYKAPAKMIFYCEILKATKALVNGG